MSKSIGLTMADTQTNLTPALRDLARARFVKNKAKAARRQAAMGFVQNATRSPYAWVTESTETYNEHWMEEGRPTPYEKFPQYPYMEAFFDFLQAERIVWIEKSRDMMVTWACVAYLTYSAMLRPECGVLFQCQKEDKSVQLVDYAKCLYRRQHPRISEVYPLVKPIDRQDTLTLEFANGSYVHGIPGGADQIRSFHPWGLLNDESSFQPEAGECFTEALSAVKGKLIFDSSAGPGWFADARRDIIRTVD